MFCKNFCSACTHFAQRKSNNAASNLRGGERFFPPLKNGDEFGAPLKKFDFLLYNSLHDRCQRRSETHWYSFSSPRLSVLVFKQDSYELRLHFNDTRWASTLPANSAMARLRRGGSVKKYTNSSLSMSFKLSDRSTWRTKKIKTGVRQQEENNTTYHKPKLCSSITCVPSSWTRSLL